MAGPRESVQPGRVTGLLDPEPRLWNPPLGPSGLGPASLGSLWGQSHGPRGTADGPPPPTSLPFTGWVASCRVPGRCGALERAGPQGLALGAALSRGLDLGGGKRVEVGNQVLSAPPFPRLADGDSALLEATFIKHPARCPPQQRPSVSRAVVSMDSSAHEPPLLCLGLPPVKQEAGLAGSPRPARSPAEGLLPGGGGEGSPSRPGVWAQGPSPAGGPLPGLGEGGPRRQGSGRAQSLSLRPQTSLMANCQAPRRPWLASHMSTVFISLLCFPSFLGAAVFLCYAVWQ